MPFKGHLFECAASVSTAQVKAASCVRYQDRVLRGSVASSLFSKGVNDRLWGSCPGKASEKSMPAPGWRVTEARQGP